MRLTSRLWVFFRLMLSISMYIAGSDEESRLLRKTLLRHCNLMMVLVLRSISDSVSRRLPTLDDVVSAGMNLLKVDDSGRACRWNLNQSMALACLLIRFHDQRWDGVLPINTGRHQFVLGARIVVHPAAEGRQTPRDHPRCSGRQINYGGLLLFPSQPSTRWDFGRVHTTR